jgi:hypothetical protein
MVMVSVWNQPWSSGMVMVSVFETAKKLPFCGFQSEKCPHADTTTG